MTSFYGEDLAYIHNQGYGGLSEAAAKLVLAHFRSEKIKAGQLTDLGCGSGQLLARVMEKGHEGTGVDTAAAFLKLAAQKAPHAHFIHGSARDCPLPPSHAVTAIGEVFNYAPPGTRKAPSLLPPLRRIAGALPRGGLFLFDLILPGARPSLTSKGWSEGEDWMVLVDAKEDVKRARLARRILTFRQIGETWRRGEESHLQLFYSKETVLEALSKAGFRAKTLGAYGNHPLLPRRLGFYAIKS